MQTCIPSRDFKMNDMVKGRYGERQYRLHGGGSSDNFQSFAVLHNWQVCSCLTTSWQYLLMQQFRQSPARESRKWGVYYVVGLVMKCYFRVRGFLLSFFVTSIFWVNLKLKRIALTRNILRSLEAHRDLPALSEYPKAHQVSTTFLWEKTYFHFSS